MTPRYKPFMHYAPGWMWALCIPAVLALLFGFAVWGGLWLFGYLSSLLVPLVLAIVLGVIFAPLVDKLEKIKLPRAVGAILVLLLIIALVGGAVWVTVVSVMNQWPVIQQQLQAGLDKIGSALAALKIPQATLDQINQAIKKEMPTITSRLGSAIASGVSGVIALAFGGFLALYMLFLVLSDFHNLAEWVGTHIGLPDDLGRGIIDDVTSSLRGYFVGSTIIAAVTSAIIAIALIIFKVPLVLPITLVTFLLSYIPFFGAIIAGVFATFIALGSGGLYTALAILAVVLISQNVVQMPIQSWALGDALELHPLVVLIATMVGSLLAGLVGATLGAPITAMVVRGVKRIREAAENVDVAPSSVAAVISGANRES